MTCKNCGIGTELGTVNYYSVHDALWKAHGAGKGELCLACLQANVGRPLALSDFHPCPASIAAAMAVASCDMAAAAIWGQGDFSALANDTIGFLEAMKRAEFEAEMRRNEVIRSHMERTGDVPGIIQAGA